MKKILRYLVIGVVAAIAFLVAIVAIFVAVFDANAYKSDISSLVREHTGRELVFLGDVEMTIFPALGMKLGAMSFSNREGFGALPMIKVSEASISVDMASLVRMTPEVDKLVLRDLEVNLITNKAGETNWDDLLRLPQEAPAAPAPGAEETGTESRPKRDIKGAFGGLDLKNIRLLWLDEQAQSKLEVTDLDISTGRIVPNRPFPLKLHLETRGDVDVSVDLQSDIEYLFEQQRLTLDKIQLALNEYQVSGSLRLADFAKPTPSLRFDLATQNIDVDALTGTPPAAGEAGPEAPGDDAGAAEPAEDVRIQLPMQTLRDLDIDGIFRIARLKAQNLHMQDIVIAVKAQDGQVGLKPVTLNMYSGDVETSVVIDVRSDVPKYGIDGSLQSIQAGDLLSDYLGKEQISGELAAQAKLNTRGEWVSELKKNLNGNLNLAFRDGALKGFNIRHSIDAAKAKIRGKKAPTQETLETDFSSLTLSGVIRNGVFSSEDLDLQAPLLRVGGEGSADLNREVVDYLVNAKLVGTVEGQEGEAADELAGLEIPVSIKGPFADPKIDVLLDEMLKARADAEKARLKAEIEAKKEELKRQIEAEKKALAESKKREAQKKLEIEKARQKEKLEAEKDKLKDDLLKKLFD